MAGDRANADKLLGELQRLAERESHAREGTAMSNTDEPISIRPPLPICCALLAAGRQPGPSHSLGSCALLPRRVGKQTDEH